MSCPHCASTTTTERPDRTALGYRRFRCRRCKRGFNERTGTPFNYLEYPTDVVCLVVLWRYRYTLSLRDIIYAELRCARQFRESNSPVPRAVAPGAFLYQCNHS